MRWLGLLALGALATACSERAAPRGLGDLATPASMDDALDATDMTSAAPDLPDLAPWIVTATWQPVMPAMNPGARAGHGLVYDELHQRLVLFGGVNEARDYADGTWTYDGTTWALLPTAHQPPLRWGAVMAYDSGRQRVVLFGGQMGGAIADDHTWELVDDDWLDVTPASSPPKRWSAAGAWDVARQRLVVFGGWLNGDPPDGTWEYDGATWTHLSNAGGPTDDGGYPLAAYDAGAQQVALLVDPNVNGQLDVQLWSFDGSHWQRITPSLLPAEPGQTALAYAPGLGLVQHGGIGDGARTWIYDGQSGRAALQTLDPHPLAVNSQAMAWDTKRGCLVLFGGGGDDGHLRDETWELRP